MTDADTKKSNRAEHQAVNQFGYCDCLDILAGALKVQQLKATRLSYPCDRYRLAPATVGLSL